MARAPEKSPPRLTSDVVRVAWRAVGAPLIEPLSDARECARCGDHGPVTTRKVVSDTFTAFDGWKRPGTSGVCSACGWAYTTPQLRAVPFLVDRASSTLRELGGLQLAAVLTCGPLEVGQAVTVPARAGRKHVLPAARWGMVTVDDLPLPWSATDAQRMTSALTLIQEYSAKPTTLIEATPPYRWLASHPVRDWPRLQQLWGELHPWRTDPSPWLATVQVVERLTRRHSPQAS